jgi:uroporphyrinogen-III decarboxylase
MDPKTRVLKTLNHEEPDQVPLLGEGIDSVPILEKYGASSLSGIIGIMRWARFIIGWRKIFGWLARRPSAMALVGKGIVKVMRKMGYDAAPIPESLYFTKSAFPSTKEYVDEYGRKFIFSKIDSGGKETDIPFYEGGYFDTEDPEASYEKWGPLDPDHPTRAATYKAALKEAKEDIYAFPSMIGFLEGTWESFGFPTFTKLLYNKPQFIERVIRERGDFSVALTENMLNLGAETFLIYDDAGHKNGPFLRPQQYEKLIVPQLKRVCDKVHSYNGKVILHSCGNVNKLIDLIIKAGIDGLNPIEPGSGMDIFQLKKDYGDKLCFVGNVDPISLLTHGTPDMVEAYVKRLMQEVAPGGGFMLASGHSITYSVKLENYEAMLAAGRKYGKYPIHIE